PPRSLHNDPSGPSAARRATGAGRAARTPPAPARRRTWPITGCPAPRSSELLRASQATLEHLPQAAVDGLARSEDARAHGPHRGDHGVLGGVDRYAIQPGVESAVAAKLRQGSISLDEGFLGDILCFRRVTHVAHDQLDEFVLVLEHQRIECPLVPALHAAYQAQITCIGAHAPPLYPAQRAAVPCAE